MHKIEDLIEKSTKGDKIETLIKKRKSVIILFDGMNVVNRIKLGPAIKNCRDFATQFLHIVAEGMEADEIRIEFDRYVRDSLKLSSRQKRNTSTPNSDPTSLVNSTLKKLLSHIQTKQYPTIFKI